eukprot:13081807-Alexandrium_andersonii.AAC.1
MYGLVDRKSGYAVKKPWRVITNWSPLQQYLSRKCADAHKHVTCSGSIAAQSAFYSPDLAKSVLKCFEAGIKDQAKETYPADLD